jgi:hypothetical protein
MVKNQVARFAYQHVEKTGIQNLTKNFLSIEQQSESKRFVCVCVRGWENLVIRSNYAYLYK